jgi:hypothetical protein
VVMKIEYFIIPVAQGISALGKEVSALTSF